MNKGFIGVDLATESARALLLNESGEIVGRSNASLASVQRADDGRLTQDPQSWLQAVGKVLSQICAIARDQSITPVAMVISATSGTFVLTDLSGVPIAPAAMYNDGRAPSPIERALVIARENNASPSIFMHVPEFVVAWLSQSRDIATDWSHGMKSGVDLHSKTWSEKSRDAARSGGFSLPEVVAPSVKIATVSQNRADQLSIPMLTIYAGMTDGCTGQISAGGAVMGSAVTTLGTTLVLKVVAEKEITGPGYYSHLLPTNRWLGGGASNLGGISLSTFLSTARSNFSLQEWDEKAATHGPASFVTYPLVGKGERFPIASKELISLASNKPLDEIDQFRAILEGIGFAERYGYEILSSAGADTSGELTTVGGGARSAIWCAIRATILNRAVIARSDSGSDLGAAMIAMASDVGGDLAQALDAMKTSEGKIFSPNETERNILEEKYQSFVELISAFRG